ncbi:MAG: hypothetical protein ABIS45_14330 [Burkholderiales bacterium]
MLERLGTNATQLIGILSFATATIACLIAARRSEFRDARVWKWLALAQFILVIEILAGFRHRISDFARKVLTHEGLYTQAHGKWQETVIISTAMIAFIVLMIILFWRRGAGLAPRIATVFTIAVLALFAIETVSLHALDAVYYRPIGPVLMIAWLWAATAAGISVAASCACRHRRGVS